MESFYIHLETTAAIWISIQAAVGLICSIVDWLLLQSLPHGHSVDSVFFYMVEALAKKYLAVIYS
jgi:hypothetical protein